MKRQSPPEGLNPTYPGCSAVILGNSDTHRTQTRVLILLTLDAAL